MAALIEVRHIRKTFGEKVALDDVSFTVEQGKTFVIPARRVAASPRSFGS
jgi:ABC-type multidrug transport system ATPase subunit